MIGITVTLQHAAVTGRDKYQNDVITWTDETVPGCAFVPMAESEATSGTEETISGAELYMPPGTQVGPLDRVVVNGVTWQVTGTSSQWQSPYTSVQSPVLARLREVKGAEAHIAGGGGQGGA